MTCGSFVPAKSAIPCFVDEDTMGIIAKNMPHVNPSSENFYGPRLECREYPQKEGLLQAIDLAGLLGNQSRCCTYHRCRSFPLAMFLRIALLTLTDFKEVLLSTNNSFRTWIPFSLEPRCQSFIPPIKAMTMLLNFCEGLNLNKVLSGI